MAAADEPTAGLPQVVVTEVPVVAVAAAPAAQLLLPPRTRHSGPAGNNDDIGGAGNGLAAPPRTGSTASALGLAMPVEVVLEQQGQPWSTRRVLALTVVITLLTAAQLYLLSLAKHYDTDDETRQLTAGTKLANLGLGWWAVFLPFMVWNWRELHLRHLQRQQLGLVVSGMLLCAGYTGYMLLVQVITTIIIITLKLFNFKERKF